jgi:RNA polymerase sigma-70 factor (ECF subfamily)
MSDSGDLLEDFGAFYRANVDTVVAYCVARTRSPELAADIAAEVFAAALVGRARYRSERGTPQQWLLGIAANKVADAQRRGRVERRAQRKLGIAPITWSDDDLEWVSSRSGGSELVTLLAQLPRQQRDALEAHIVRERSYAEIAAAEGVSEAVIRKRVSRGLANMRARLTREGRA